MNADWVTAKERFVGKGFRGALSGAMGIDAGYVLVDPVRGGLRRK